MNTALNTPAITVGSTWQARSKLSFVPEIRIIDSTANHRVWRVDSVTLGRELRMTADHIHANFTPSP